MCRQTSPFDSNPMTDSTQNPTAPKSTKYRNSNFTVQNQIKAETESGFVPRDTEISEFLDVVDFGGVALSEESVIQTPSSLWYPAHTHVSTCLCVSTSCVYAHIYDAPLTTSQCG